MDAWVGHKVDDQPIRLDDAEPVLDRKQGNCPSSNTVGVKLLQCATELDQSTVCCVLTWVLGSRIGRPHGPTSSEDDRGSGITCC
eukprot:1649270-Prymnesium_polylepis.2